MPGSTLTREADFRLMLGAGPEKSVLSTKTFMAKLAYLLLAAGRAGRRPGSAMCATLRAAADDIEALPHAMGGWTRCATWPTASRTGPTCSCWAAAWAIRWRWKAR